MAHAKLTNGQLTYFTVGETLEIEGLMVTNPSIELIEKIDYKEVIYASGNGGMYQTESNIVIETPIPEPIAEVVLSPTEQRELAYKTEKLIEWQGIMLTCDEARVDRMSVYYELGEMEEYGALKALWLAARVEIQTRLPDYPVNDEFVM